MKKTLLITTWLILSLCAGNALAFDHQHTQWNSLLGKHVHWTESGNASRVDYAGVKKEKTRFDTYLGSLSAVTRQEYDSWSKPQKLAFLINAYNAFTIDLVLTRYPDLESVKDLGSFLSTPWKKRFFTLLGEERNLDEIEHGMIRKRGRFDDPRIHFAVVCASIGCPALRNEAFTAEQLDSQLEDGLVRFLSDKSRNHYNSQSDKLEVSKIFDWYSEDFEQGHRGFESLEDFFANYANLLSDNQAGREKITRRKAAISYLNYDWRLNDLGR